jgi:hypothetical protein
MEQRILLYGLHTFSPWFPKFIWLLCYSHVLLFCLSLCILIYNISTFPYLRLINIFNLCDSCIADIQERLLNQRLKSQFTV